MTILAAVTADDEGLAALEGALVEGGHRNTDVVALNLRREPLEVPAGARVTVVDRTLGVEDGDASVLATGPPERSYGHVECPGQKSCGLYHPLQTDDAPRAG